ncbi:MAG: hypothetical protein AB1938_21755 [Myxococcota bacterium]
MSRHLPAGRLFLPALLLAVGVVACKGDLGGVRINVTLVNDTRTQCLQAWAKTELGSTSYSEFVPRVGSTYVFGVQGSAELTGQVTVGVSLFSTPDCSGTQYHSVTQAVVLEPNRLTSVNFEITFGSGDAGVDGGVDGGMDGGCEPSACTTPPVCYATPATCVSGACSYAFANGGTPCGDGGVCNGSGQCGSNVCAFADAGAGCDDGLACTTADRCQSGMQCRGDCPNTLNPVCGSFQQPLACGADGGCVLVPANVNGPCGGGNRCDNAGGCVPWFPFRPSNIPDDVLALRQPTAAWIATRGSDGGACVLDTSLPTPGPREVGANCGFLGVGQVVPQADGGVDLAVFAATSLTVPEGVELRFVGVRPAVLAVFGDATVHGTLNAAAAIGAEAPAGTGSADCTAVDATTDEHGGPGGGYRTEGGRGGNNSAVATTNGSATGIFLRGGCQGGRGGGAAPGDGGLGGGALQLTVSGLLTVGDGGVLTVSGAGGLGGSGDTSGGGGGGSGGTLLLEANRVNLVNCALTANGGGGGQGGKGPVGAPVAGGNGEDGRTASATAANGGNIGGTAGGTGGAGAVLSASGSGGSNGGGSEGGGGGGAGVGLIRINVTGGTCTTSGAVISGERTGSTCN